jgi:hypothetical protein
MSVQKGLLLAMMEPPPAATEEFHAWYDTEHIPQRQGVKGFITAVRFVCTEGWPQYVAVYDLESAAVLDEPEYRAIGGANLSPWSKRIGAKVTGQWRFGGTQIHPGDGVTGASGAPAALLLVRWRSAPAASKSLIVQGLRKNFDRRQGVLQARAFEATAAGGSDFVVLVESTLPLSRSDLDLEAFGDAAKGIDLMNVYAPYWRRGDS